MGHGSSINRVWVALECHLVKTRKMSREMFLPGRVCRNSGGDCLCPKGASRPCGYQEIDSLTWEPGEALCVHLV